MKILFMISGLGMGGAERQICDLADKFIAHGHQVKIAYMTELLVVKPKSLGVELIWLGGNASTISMFKVLNNFLKLIKQYRPDVIHSHMFHATVLGRLSRLFNRSSSLISTAHNTEVGSLFRLLAYRATHFLEGVFTNVSREAVEAFEMKKAVPMGGMLIVHNGIDTDYFRYSESGRKVIRQKYNLNDKKVFIAIGRFHEQKDYPNLLAAFRKFIEANDNAHLLIVGDGVLRPEIERQLREESLSDKVSLLGIRRDVADLLSAADVFILPSAWEGFGLVVAEAMACERIVIATDSGGVAEVLGKQGILIPPKNSDALANAMEQAVNFGEQQAKAMGLAARKRVVEKYSLDSVVDNWLAIYQAR